MLDVFNLIEELAALSGNVLKWSGLSLDNDGSIIPGLFVCIVYWLENLS